MRLPKVLCLVFAVALLSLTPRAAGANAITWYNYASTTGAQYIDASLSGLTLQNINIGSASSSMTYEFLALGDSLGYRSLMSGSGQAIRFSNTSRYGLTQFFAYDDEFAVPGTSTLGVQQLLTFVSSGGSTSLYIDGVLQASLARSLGISNVVELGGGGNGDPFSGTIYGAAVWGRALSAEEISANFQAEDGPVVPEPATLLLVGGGLAAAWIRRRRMRRS